MNPEEFRKNAHSVVDWLADYYKSIEKYPVKSLVRPGEIFEQIPDQAPDEQESFEQLMLDVDSKIMPGITHWQHPNFHAFFPANTSFPSILAEMITAGLGAQCMIWETSPAAAELEEKMALWFKAAMGLPADWHGVIQDTASTATLAALLTAREQKTGYHINEKGFDSRRLRVYCSTQTHSSIDKAVKIAGFGSENLVKIAVDTHMAMDPDALEAAIIADTQNGMVPCAVVSTLGTTSTLAFDPIKRIGALCRKFDIWHHVDAAYAGSAWVLPEMRGLATGLDTADSYVFNPHKWLFTNFD
ncbi:MAG: pyridoxal-dependent decarboxylase, partial [Cyclobacteriaceae bacterium]|nr:pyridoxal-dependent decarboxylase [Cyclobacteriaceae bacterium]